MAKKKAATKTAEGGVLIVANNKKARHDYEILNVYEAGVVLQGSEVKSIRAGGINFKDSYVRFAKGELFLVGCHIAPYSHAPVLKYEPERLRKLLLHKKEIERLSVQTTQKGLTILPLKAYFKNGRCKIEIGVGRGKKLYDKRQDMKSREAKRDIDRAIKGARRSKS